MSGVDVDFFTESRTAGTDFRDTSPCIIGRRYKGKAGCDIQPAPPCGRTRPYWMGATVADTVKGSVGAVAPWFCQIAPAWLLANARLPVEAKLVGKAVV